MMREMTKDERRHDLGAKMDEATRQFFQALLRRDHWRELGHDEMAQGSQKLADDCWAFFLKLEAKLERLA